MSIMVDAEFKALIPPLSPEEYAQLEENCVREGIRDPLVVWATPSGTQILVDGHNRMKIAAEHAGMHFDVVEKTFDTRKDAEAWIIRKEAEYNSQAELAHDTGISRPGFSNIICGKTVPTLQSFARICNACNMSADEVGMLVLQLGGIRE